jgi:hypothetical protein
MHDGDAMSGFQACEATVGGVYPRGIQHRLPHTFESYREIKVGKKHGNRGSREIEAGKKPGNRVFMEWSCEMNASFTPSLECRAVNDPHTILVEPVVDHADGPVAVGCNPRRDGRRIHEVQRQLCTFFQRVRGTEKGIEDHDIATDHHRIVVINDYVTFSAVIVRKSIHGLDQVADIARSWRRRQCGSKKQDIRGRTNESKVEIFCFRSWPFIA